MRENKSYQDVKNVCVFGNMRRASRTVTQFYDEAYRSCGLRSTQVSMLLNLSIAGSISVSDLADFLCMDQSTVTRNLKPLERQGYVKITKEEKDARRKAVSITEKGTQVLDEALRFWETAQEHMEKKIGKERFENFLLVLKDITKM